VAPVEEDPLAARGHARAGVRGDRRAPEAGRLGERADRLDAVADDEGAPFGVRQEPLVVEEHGAVLRLDLVERRERERPVPREPVVDGRLQLSRAPHPHDALAARPLVWLDDEVPAVALAEVEDPPPVAPLADVRREVGAEGEVVRDARDAACREELGRRRLVGRDGPRAGRVEGEDVADDVLRPGAAREPEDPVTGERRDLDAALGGELADGRDEEPVSIGEHAE